MARIHNPKLFPGAANRSALDWLQDDVAAGNATVLENLEYLVKMLRVPGSIERLNAQQEAQQVFDAACSKMRKD